MPHECTDCGRAFEDGSKEMLSGCPNCGGTTFQFRPGDTGRPEGSDGPPDPEVDGVTRTVGNAASAVRNLVTGGNGSTGPPERDQVGPERSGDSPATAGNGESEERETAAQSSGGGGGDEPATEEVTVPSTPEWPGAEDSEAESEASQQSAATGEEEPAQPEQGDIVEADGTAPGNTGQGGRPPVPDPRPLSARPDTDEEGAEGDPEESATAETTEGIRAGASGERPSLSELRAELNDQFESIRVVEPGQYELNLMELYDREEYIIALQEDGKYTIQLPERWDER